MLIIMFIECLTSRTKAREKEELTVKNQKLHHRIESLRQQLSHEKNRNEVKLEENRLLRDQNQQLSDDKSKLIETMNSKLIPKSENKKFMKLLESMSHGIKSIEHTTTNELANTGQNSELLTERSREIHTLRDTINSLQNENTRLKMEVKFYKLLLKMVDKHQPTSIINHCLKCMKMLYGMYVKLELTAKYINVYKKKINVDF